MANENNVYPEIAISRFDPFQDRNGVWKPGVISQKDNLYRQLMNFKEGYYAPMITELRKLSLKSEKDKYKQEKLPAFTLSAYINGKREMANVQRHSGILVIDLDYEGIISRIKKMQENNPAYNIASLRDELAGDDDDPQNSILFSGISASGTGLFLCYLIDPQQHLEAFNAISWHYDNHYGIKVDASGKDVTRLRFCTYDPDAVVRPMNRVMQYRIPEEYVQWKKVQDLRRVKLRENVRPYKSNSEAASNIINTATKMILQAMDGSRHDQILKAARLLGGYVASGVFTQDFAYDCLVNAVEDRHDETPSLNYQKTIEWGLEKGMLSPIQLHVISPDDPQFQYFVNEREEQQTRIKDFYNTILKNNNAGVPFHEIDFDTLCNTFGIDRDRAIAIATRLYRNNADEFNFHNLSKPHQLEVFISKRWEIRRNIVTNELYVRVKKSDNPWKTMRLEDLWMNCNKQGFKTNWEDLCRIMNTEMVERYNPFEDYFKSVHTKYDASIDHIGELASHFKIKNADTEYFTEMLRKMLVRTVKCALEQSYVNRFVFVFSQIRQNTGKTWFFRWLSPWGMDEYYAENPLYDSKDDRIRMSEVLIYNLEELSTITKKDVNTLKAIISAGSSKERRPYERNSETMPRRCSFFGSTNRNEFLTDDINTRWLVFELDTIDWTYREVVSKHQVWAQAYDLYKQGWNCELTDQEAGTRDNLNEQFVEATSEDILLQRFFKPCDHGHPSAFWLTTSDITARLQDLSNNPKLSINLNNIGRALRRNGYTAKYCGKTRVFPAIPINQMREGLNDARTFQNQIDKQL